MGHLGDFSCDCVEIWELARLLLSGSEERSVWSGVPQWFTYRGGLTPKEGTLLFKGRVVILVAARPQTLESLHSVNQGDNQHIGTRDKFGLMARPHS